MSQISMGDMLKMGAMKLIGPSKEERKEEDQQIAVKSHATDKLFGEHLGGGLQRVMDNITLKDGDTLNGVQGGDPRRQILNQQAELAGAGIGVDITKLHSKELGVAATEMQRITGLLQSQIDMYSMQKKTGVVADNVPTTAQPLAEVTEATKPQNTTTPPVVEKDAMSGDIGAGMSQEELLAELVRLTQINTNLLKKGNRITEAIEV